MAQVTLTFTDWFVRLRGWLWIFQNLHMNFSKGVCWFVRSLMWMCSKLCYDWLELKFLSKASSSFNHLSIYRQWSPAARPREGHLHSNICGPLKSHANNCFCCHAILQNLHCHYVGRSYIPWWICQNCHYQCFASHHDIYFTFIFGQLCVRNRKLVL